MITVRSDNQALSFEYYDENLLDFLNRSGFFLDSPCGGTGTCGKCKIIASGQLSELSAEEIAFLSDDEITKGFRLACQTKALGNVELILPEQQEIVSVTENHIPPFPFDPAVKNISGKIRALGKELDTAISPDSYTMAVDIGTTTLAAYFYRSDSPSLIDTQSAINHQRRFGADVISRIQNTMEHPETLSEMGDSIRQQISDMAEKFADSQGISSEQIVACCIAANTTMLHFLMKYPAAGIAVAPFTPHSLFGLSVSATELELAIHPDAPVYLMPCISSYVGADITAGMLAYNMEKAVTPQLLVDVGTNGEMALCDGKGSIKCCSTAAGPAFEGAHIKYGMGGVAGAISEVFVKNGQLAIKTIANEPPKGICGSGLIDAVAVMVEYGVVDETGRICDTDEYDGILSGYLIEIDGDPVFLLDTDSGIHLTQQDIREVQLAKAAVAAGIQVLMQESGINASQIDQVILAGGFGAHLSARSGTVIGLFEKELLPKIVVAGNTAGAGASKYLLSDCRTAIEDILQKSHYIELSTHGGFMELYVENMMF